MPGVKNNKCKGLETTTSLECMRDREKASGIGA